MVQHYFVLSTAVLVLLVEGYGLHISTSHGVKRLSGAESAGLSGKNLRTEQRRNDCPGFVPGISPNRRNKSGCISGAKVGPVDHELAFGFSPSSVDWRLCDLHEYPDENHRVCYRTTIDVCDRQYKLYLNRRNFGSLSQKCPNEREQLAEPSEGEIIFASPRYKCVKKSGKFHEYRRSEFCLYNISIADCASGRVIIEAAERDELELEGRTNESVCHDYIQFYHNYDDRSILKTSRFCGSELYNLPVLPATQFVAVFWTDIADNNVGFSFKVKCQPSVIDEDQGSGLNETLHT